MTSAAKARPLPFYAALVSGILRSHAPIEPGPAEMLRAVNLSLAERRIEAQFVSLIYAVWDDPTRTLLVTNSGLPRPIHVHGGKNHVIEATGLPLGLFDDVDYDEFRFKMKPGDLFVFFLVTACWTPETGRAHCLAVDGWKKSFRNARRIPQTALLNLYLKPWPNTPPGWKLLTIRP